MRSLFPRRDRSLSPAALHESREETFPIRAPLVAPTLNEYLSKHSSQEIDAGGGALQGEQGERRGDSARPREARAGPTQEEPPGGAGKG